MIKIAAIMTAREAIAPDVVNEHSIAINIVPRSRLLGQACSRDINNQGDTRNQKYNPAINLSGVEILADRLKNQINAYDQ